MSTGLPRLSASRHSIDNALGDVEPPAPYPTSVSQIVEMITSGEPIPGIREVPDTVLEGQASQPTATNRKKPWEKDDAGAGEEVTRAPDSVANRLVPQNQVKISHSDCTSLAS